MFYEFPQVSKNLWAGHFWEQGYFVRTVDEQMTEDVIKRYIEKHNSSYDQLTFWQS